MAARSAVAPGEIDGRPGNHLWRDTVTTRIETICDCLGWLPHGAARVLADRTHQQGWLTTESLRRRLEEQPGRWGNSRLRELLTLLEQSDGLASEAERILANLLRGAGISGWVAGYPVRVGGRRFVLDFAFPAVRLAIEVDGYAYHSSDDRYQTDRTRQNALIVAGWRILRFTWADLTDRPGYVLAEIRQLLAA